MIEYSVIIRTIGKAGQKYQALLDSIAGLIPQPKEVIVVLPEGYEPPPERLGWETFAYSTKGMVVQRVFGIAQCTTPYALICDDDVCFESDFVQKLHEPIAAGIAELSSGPLYSFLPEKGIKSFIDFISGAASPTVFRRDRYCSVLRTSGYSYNRHLDSHKARFYPAQSLPGTCFYADISALKQVSLQEEAWLDANGYAAMDDQVMFYKAWLRGIRTVVAADCYYVHQDARTSTKNNKAPVLYSAHMNRIIFWHRFIFKVEKNPLLCLWSCICFGYRIAWQWIWIFLNFLRKRYTKEDIRVIWQAFRDSRKFLTSREYRAYPSVFKE